MPPRRHATRREFCSTPPARWRRRSSEIRRRYGVEALANAVWQERTSSQFRPISSDAKALDGLNVQIAVCDEIVSYKTSEVYDVLLTTMGKRRNRGGRLSARTFARPVEPPSSAPLAATALHASSPKRDRERRIVERWREHRFVERLSMPSE